MRTINALGNIAGGVFHIVKKGLLYLVIGSAIGAVCLTLLISAIIYTAF